MSDTKKQQMQRLAINTRIIGFKFLGPTNYKGARIKLTDKRNHSTKTISFHYGYTTAGGGAADYLISEGWHVVGCNEDYGVLIIDCADRDKEL